jgi:fatty-acyl-CoA synthase
MLGLIQDRQLLLSGVIAHAGRHHADVPVVSRRRDGSFHRSTWSEIDRRVRQLADVLLRHGIRTGDRIATLAWNNYRHLEIYFAATAIGAICHLINPRLFPQPISYIAGHAEDRVLFYDIEFASLAQSLAASAQFALTVCLCDDDELPPSSNANSVSYERLIASGDPGFAYPEFDERTAASLCYTSGTTGNPKGVLSSHRALMLHAMGARTDDIFHLSARSVACAIVPLYHAHGSWGLPFAAAMSGSALVLPGLQLDGPNLADTIRRYGVTIANGVPTIWQNVCSHLVATNQEIAPLQRVVIAGSAPARKLIVTLEHRFGVEVCHLWGMTETGPCATSGARLPQPDKTAAADIGRKIRQGHGIYGVEVRISNQQHVHCPWGDEHIGQLQVRGPYIVSGYFKGEGAGSVDANGWFTTGDVASIDTRGDLRIVDRDKDLVKSGGEWISSIDVENAAMSFPGIREAAVIAMPHEQWGERPLLIIVRDGGAQIAQDDLLRFLEQRVAKWWLPDRIAFATELPKTGTGKVMKAELRKQFAERAGETRSVA